jgi:curved DNA-binding protein CbpA
MDFTKDYYAILGVLPTAELVVIKAAYKAMLKVYHPDKFNGSQTEAHAKSIEINDAYSILSDKNKRVTYDKKRNKNSSEEYSDNDKKEEYTANHSYDKDWALVCKYNSLLITLASNLDKISPKLAFAFKTELLGTKKFNQARGLADNLTNNYLKTYFGPNRHVMDYAKKLLVDGYRDAAKELNQVVNLFGKDLNAKSVINQIEVEFDLYSHSSEAKQKEREARQKEHDARQKEHDARQKVDKLKKEEQQERDFYSALESSHFKALKLMLENGFVLKNKINKNGKTPLEIARHRGDKRIASLLREYD